MAVGVRVQNDKQYVHLMHSYPISPLLCRAHGSVAHAFLPLLAVHELTFPSTHAQRSSRHAFAI